MPGEYAAPLPERGREWDAPSPAFAGGAPAATPRVRDSERRVLEGVVSVCAPHPGLKGKEKGPRRPFLFSERSGTGWERRSPLSFFSPISLSVFKFHFRPTGFGGASLEDFPALPPPSPLPCLLLPVTV